MPECFTAPKFAITAINLLIIIKIYFTGKRIFVIRKNLVGS